MMKIMPGTLCLFALALFVLIQMPALAEEEDRIIAKPVPLPERMPEPQDTIEIADFYTEELPDSADETVFSLSALVLEGVTSYQDGELSVVYADMLGQTITLATLYDIADDLTEKYRNDGYDLARVVVPPQIIEKGIARLYVAEGL